MSTNEPAWTEYLAKTSLPELETDVEADVCVVGLGGSGLSCVLELLSLGQRVVGIDAGIIAGGAAGRNGGFLLAGTSAFYHDAVAALGRERARRIYQITLAELDRMGADTPMLVNRSGSLRLAASVDEERDCDAQFVAMRADGFAVERYEGGEGSGLLVPNDGSFNPLARCRKLARRAIELGASLYEQSRADSITSGEVRTARGTASCTHVIVAIDGGLEHILPELSGRVRTARLQMLGTAPATEVRIPRPVYSRYGYDYWQQLPDGRVVIGGCRDYFRDEEWTTDKSPSDDVQFCIERVLRETVGVTQPVTHRWAASVSYSDGVLPVLEEVRRGVWAIGGYSGTGNVIGAIYGRMVAQLAVNGKSQLYDQFMPSTPVDQDK